LHKTYLVSRLRAVTHLVVLFFPSTRPTAHSAPAYSQESIYFTASV
jgi:hypothetical protein